MKHWETHTQKIYIIWEKKNYKNLISKTELINLHRTEQIIKLIVAYKYINKMP